MRHVMPPLLRRSMCLRALGVTASTLGLALAFLGTAPTGQAGITAGPDPSPNVVKPDPFPFSAARVIAVARPIEHATSAVTVRAQVPVASTAPRTATFAPVAARATPAKPATHNAGGESSVSAPRGRNYRSRPSSRTHLASGAIEHLAGNHAPGVFGGLSPPETRIVGSLLALLALTGFGVAVRVARLERDG